MLYANPRKDYLVVHFSVRDRPMWSIDEKKKGYENNSQRPRVGQVRLIGSVRDNI